MKGSRQRLMHCPCGNAKVLALGLCATCYTLKRQDEEYLGGLREAVLERDAYRGRVCAPWDGTSDRSSFIIGRRVVGPQPDDLALSWVSRQSSSNQDRPPAHASSPA